VHAVALSGDGEHLLVGSELGLRLLDRRGNVRYRLGRNGRAFSAVALSPRLDAGLAMERAGRLYRLDFEQATEEVHGEPLQVAAYGIWEQRDDLYSLDFAPHGGGDGGGLITIGHHNLGLTALDGRGQLLWRLGPDQSTRKDPDIESGESATFSRGKASDPVETDLPGRTWHAAISADGGTIYASALGGADGGASAGVRRPAPSSHRVVAIDAALGKPLKALTMGGRVTLLAALPAPLAVAVVHHSHAEGIACCQLTALDTALRKQAWSLPCPPDVSITALASAPGATALIVGTNGGELWRVGAFTGRILARYDLLYSSAVLSVAVAESGEIAAGMANGQVAFLERVRHEEQRAQ
jgi:hypothetical protein